MSDNYPRFRLGDLSQEEYNALMACVLFAARRGAVWGGTITTAKRVLDEARTIHSPHEDNDE